MAPKRSARACVADSESDDDFDYAGGAEGVETEPEVVTPRARRAGASKRRISDFNAGDLDPDASFGTEHSSARAPLKAVNMNDDAAEKRRRRKSAKISLPNLNDEGDMPQAGLSSEAVEQPEARRMQRLQSVTQIPTVNVPLDVMNSNFEEWMKMATDNKINAANSWNFALIDNFHDMSLLRNQGDNSINFQRASCTLDGCVKIWTSRVDSVGTETGKLLSNLAQEGNRAADDDEEAGSGDDEGGAAPGTQRKKKARGTGATLAKDSAQLQNKKLELEFAIDPLFRKTCADFDEGGAQGLLMSHLALGLGPDGGMRVVFDASDSVAKEAEEDEEALIEPAAPTDLSVLRSKFLPTLDMIEEKATCQSLAGFSFSKDATWDDSSFYQPPASGAADDNDDDDDFGGGFPADTGDARMDGGEDAPVEDFFSGDQAVEDDFGGGGMDGYGGGGGDDDGDGEAGSYGAETAHQGDGPRVGGTGPFVPFDPRHAPNERDLVMAMTDAEGGMLDYFDQAFLKNWAGPEHWKLRKVVRKLDADATGAAKPKREKKEAFRIDFTTPATKDLKTLSKELFAPVTRGGGINLPGTSAAAKARKGKKGGMKEKEKDLHLLPDDMHFSSRQLVTLFLKPKFSLKMRGHRAPLTENSDGEIDEQFWAKAANEAAARQGEGDENVGDGSIPFNTQFFHDDYDDGPGFDDAYDGGGSAAPPDLADEGEQDLLATTAGQTRRVRPEFVKYAKRAKRVDVRKLKENIWQGLDIVVPEQPDPEAMDMEEDTSDKHGTDPTEAREFSGVVDGLRSMYPREKMEEISTSFCFICLLHLANERGLKLEVADDGVLGGIPDPEPEKAPRAPKSDKKVGDIWGLKVYRDPDATPAA